MINPAKYVTETPRPPREIALMVDAPACPVDDDRLAELLDKCLAGELTAEERREFKPIVEADDSLCEFIAIMSEWAAAEMEEARASSAVGSALERLHEAIDRDGTREARPKRRPRMRLRAAALLVAAACAGGKVVFTVDSAAKEVSEAQPAASAEHFRITFSSDNEITLVPVYGATPMVRVPREAERIASDKTEAFTSRGLSRATVSDVVSVAALLTPVVVKKESERATVADNHETVSVYVGCDAAVVDCGPEDPSPQAGMVIRLAAYAVTPRRVAVRMSAASTPAHVLCGVPGAVCRRSDDGSVVITLPRLK
jgi:hypothetical protein